MSAIQIIICLQNYRSDVALTLYAVVMFLSFLSAALVYSSLIMKSNEMIELLTNLETAINSSKPHTLEHKFMFFSLYKVNRFILGEYRSCL